MTSRIDEAGHTKAFDYSVAEHWGESQRTKRSLVGFEPTSAHTYESEMQPMEGKVSNTLIINIIRNSETYIFGRFLTFL